MHPLDSLGAQGWEADLRIWTEYLEISHQVAKPSVEFRLAEPPQVSVASIRRAPLLLPRRWLEKDHELRAPGRYLAGVGCDGSSYHSGATARDRDRLRQFKLEELGWTLHRIWPTEWWRRPREEMETLHKKLDAQLASFVTS
jgi:REase_MTES_1575